ncbi:hypothetical protein QR680_012879 [Steinernema hermaphroditum]|uniref:Uncharacterized protein n=1 Tax=Steinernema hermaphroditum TaxID=289476 RepID=A0AA39I3L8_9BILA|nr:hypothetical protein QR680_012879 [Steinernema hermaphroditum]
MGSRPDALLRGIAEAMALQRMIEEKARHVMIVEAEVDTLKAQCEALEERWLRSSSRDLAFLKAFGDLIEKTSRLKKDLHCATGSDDEEKGVDSPSKAVEECERLQKQRVRKESEVDDSFGTE